MSNPISQNEKYSKYLERLVQDLQRLDSDFRNLNKFYELIDDYIDEANEIPGTLYSFIDGLQTSVVIHTHRLFDDTSVSLPELIRIAKTHLGKIKWANKPSVNEIESHKNKIDGAAKILERIKVQRHKNYAHLDKKPVINPDDFSKNNPLKKNDIQEVINLSHGILQEHYGWKNNAHRDMKVVNAANMKTFFELLRIGRKYRKEDFKEKL